MDLANTAFFGIPLLSWIFFALLLGILGFALRARRQPKWTALAADHAPTILTTVGVIGTFSGIALGLMNFDAGATNLDTSVRNLLEGLKTAFLTSLAGMGSGLFYKAITLGDKANSTEAPKDGVGPEDVLTALAEQTTLLKATRDAIVGTEESSLAGQLKMLRTDMRDHSRESSRIRDQQTVLLRETRDAIAGTEESSLAGQLKLLRTDLGDHQRDFSRELWKRMNEFGELLARSATEQVIEALKQVIVEFNEKLTEQFGDNFKALDASVKKLVDWQDRYRIQLDRLHTLYEEQVRSIGAVEVSMRSIEESSAAIPSTIERLRVFLETAQHHLAELERHLEAFVEMRDRAIEAVPQTQESIDRIVSSIRESMDQITSSHEQLLTSAGERHDELMAQVKRVQERIASGLRSAQSDMDDAQKRFGERTADILAAVATSASELQLSAQEGRKASDTHLRTMEKLASEAQETMQAQVAASLAKTEEQLTAMSDNLRESAVDLLSDWLASQDKANTHLEDMSLAMIHTQGEIEKRVRDGLAKIEEQWREAQEKQDGRLGKLLEAMESAQKSLVKGARDAQSRETEHVRALRKEMTSGLKEMQKDMRTAMEAQRKASNEMLAGFQEAGAGLLRESAEMNRNLGENAKQMRGNLETMVKDAAGTQSRATERVVASFSKEMGELIRKTRLAIEQQQKDVNQMQNKEIQRVMNAMGKALGKIAGKFTKDYGELTDRTARALRRLENAGRRPF